MQRINAEQAAIERRLVELGVDDIQKKLNDTTLHEEDGMHVDNQPPPEPRPISAKQRALAKFVRTPCPDTFYLADVVLPLYSPPAYKKPIRVGLGTSSPSKRPWRSKQQPTEQRCNARKNRKKGRRRGGGAWAYRRRQIAL